MIDMIKRVVYYLNHRSTQRNTEMQNNRRQVFQAWVKDSEIKALESQREYEAERNAIKFIIWTVLATAIVMLISCGIQLINQWVGGAV